MVEPRHAFGLRLKRRAKLLVLGKLPGQDLDRHLAIQGYLAGQIDRAHPALRDELQNLVAGKQGGNVLGRREFGILAGVGGIHVIHSLTCLSAFGPFIAPSPSTELAYFRFLASLKRQ